ncbi:lamin tail domain-containing protein [Candidatus Woesearchaeota archaeon]|nr:lamin tail domain-containing protein [Candidatus Woesearchaeota archaeon]
MKFWFYLFIFLLLIQISNGATINEIMYNPLGNDNNMEFIEIFSCPQTDFSGYVVSDGDSNDTLTLFYFNSNSNYSLIVEEGYLIKTNNASIYKIGATIGNGLSSDDTVYFYSPLGILMDYAEIEPSIADGNGYSMSFYNGSWAESRQINGTPGYKNTVSQETNKTPQKEIKNIILEAYLDEVIYLGTQYTKLFNIKIENKDNCSEKDMITVFYSITNSGMVKQDNFTKEVGCSSYASTGEFTPAIPGDYTLCGAIINSSINETDFSDNSVCMDFAVIDTSSAPCSIKLNITTNETMIYEAGQSIKFRNSLNSEEFPFIIEYWIEDFFGNIYKDSYNTTNTNEKSWKTDIDEQDRVLFIKSIVYPKCKDSNTSDNHAEKMFIVKSETNGIPESSTESVLEITEVGKEAKFGDTVDVKVSIYKGETTMYSVKLWIEDGGKKASETTKIHLYGKHSSYNGQLPVKLVPNCGLKLKNGKYDVVIEGLGKGDRKEIRIEGIKTSACQASSEKASSSSSGAKKFDFEVTDFDEAVGVGDKLNTKVTFYNNNNEDISIKVWSYVYRGSKSYSGEREANKEEFTLKSNSLHVIGLSNIVQEAEPGDYKFKVVVNKDNQKTNSEITKDVIIYKNNIESNNEEITNKDVNDKNIENQITGNVLTNTRSLVYESSTEKAKSLVPLFIIILSVVLNIILILRR